MRLQRFLNELRFVAITLVIIAVGYGIYLIGKQVSYSYGITRNVSASEDLGWYYYYPKKHIAFGDLVLFHPNPENTGYKVALKNGYAMKYQYFLKHIVGVPGDKIEQNKDDVKITHAGKTTSYHLTYKDIFGKPLPVYQFTNGVIPQGKYFVSGLGPLHRDSYDSRYLGYVDKSRIKFGASKV